MTTLGLESPLICKDSARIAGIERQGDYVCLTLESPVIAGTVEPGQFVNVRVTEGYDPLLRRPLSVMDAADGLLRLLVQVRGKGTRALASKREGGFVGLLGPLGNSFPLPGPGKTPVYVAGGAGAAPFRFLSRRLGGGLMLLGARSESLLPMPGLLGEFCSAVRIATDDGSAGSKGTAVDLLESTDPASSVYYACGPKGMLSAFRSWLSSRAPSAEAYVSLETYMACGVGACKGCVVRTAGGSMKLCCTDGPVFPAGEVEI